jgi:hypothetical protein
MTAVRRTPLMTAFWRLHRAVFELSGGRFIASTNGFPVLVLVSRGRKSGAAKRVALQHLPEATRTSSSPRSRASLAIPRGG